MLASFPCLHLLCCRVVYERAAVEHFFKNLSAARGGRAIIMAGVCKVPCATAASWSGWQCTPCSSSNIVTTTGCLSRPRCAAGSSHAVSYAEMVPAERVIREKRRQLRRKRHGGGALGNQQQRGGGAEGGVHDVLDV